MALQSTSNPSTMADQYQTYFSKQLLDYAVQSLRKAEFAQTAALPKNAGAQSIRFFRFGEPSTASVQDLTEGTAVSSSNYRELSLGYVDATLNQIGQVIGVTDVLNATSLLNIMQQAIKTNGEDAALYMDDLIRDELVNKANRADHILELAKMWIEKAGGDVQGFLAAVDESVTILDVD